MTELGKLGFNEIENGHWIRNEKYYLIWNSYSDSFNFYKIISDDEKLTTLKSKSYVKTFNGYFLDYVDMFHYSEVVNKIVAYLRKERIYKIIETKEVPRCPHCGHNFYEGGYGLCKWCIEEIKEENENE